MDKIHSYEQIRSFVGEIRNLQKGFQTNFYWDEQKHPYWIESSSLFFMKWESCYILIHQNEGFSNLYYITTDIILFTEALKKLSVNKNYVIDIVCKENGKGEVEELIRIGFVPYKLLFRMSHIGLLAKDGWDVSEKVNHANTSDTIMIYNILHSNFDPICEQLPSIQEVKDYIIKKQVLVIKDKNDLCGFIIYEILGATSWYLRYWYTSPKYRNIKVGARLLKAALLKGKSTKRQQLWVISDNENAIKRYEHYGFKRESINDYVLIKKTYL